MYLCRIQKLESISQRRVVYLKLELHWEKLKGIEKRFCTHKFEELWRGRGGEKKLFATFVLILLNEKNLEIFAMTTKYFRRHRHCTAEQGMLNIWILHELSDLLVLCNIRNFILNLHQFISRVFLNQWNMHDMNAHEVKFHSINLLIFRKKLLLLFFSPSL